MERSGRLGALLALVVVLASCASQSLDKAGGRQPRQPVVLTLADPQTDSLELDGFAREVTRLSAGSMRIDVLKNWRLGESANEPGLIGDVRAGKAELGVVGSRAWDLVGVDSFRALGAPLLIDSYALEDRVLGSSMIAPMLDGLRPLGLAGIGVLPGPFRKPLGVARPLLSPADYAGLRIGIGQSQVAAATLRALGATPVPLVAAGSIAGLDGIEQQISSIQGNQYDKVGRYLTANISLWPRPLVVFANGRAWAALTPAQRHILVHAASGDTAAETTLVRDNEQTDTAILCRRDLLFVTASSTDLAALRRAVQPVYSQLERDPQTARFIRQIGVMSTGIPPEPTPSCANSARLAAGASPLDGVWQFTDTEGELAGAPGNAADIVPENWGTWTFVFDRGRFAITQEDRQACTWGYGTYTVHEDKFSWLFTDGGGIAPDGAENKPGEFFIYRWSLYRGMLTLYPVPGAVSPNNFLVRPWALISATPSSRFLSRRCLPPAGALPS